MPVGVRGVDSKKSASDRNFYSCDYSKIFSYPVKVFIHLSLSSRLLYG